MSKIPFKGDRAMKVYVVKSTTCIHNIFNDELSTHIPNTLLKIFKKFKDAKKYEENYLEDRGFAPYRSVETWIEEREVE